MRDARERRWLVALTLIYVALAIWLFHRAQIESWFDSQDLRKQATLPLLSDGFWRGARPPGYPLLLELFGPFSTTLAGLQLALYAAAFIVVSWGLVRRCRTPWVRVLGYAIVLFGSLSDGWLEWTHAWSTESLSMSLVVLPIGLVLAGAVAPSRPRWQRGVAWAAIALALAEWIALRDLDATWLFVATSVAALLALVLRAPSPTRRATLLAWAAAVVAVVAVAWSANGGKRWRYPLVNIIGQRVFPDPVRLAYFQRSGMPINDGTRCFAGRWACDCPLIDAFEPWLTEHGKHTYAADLLRHPHRLFLEPLAHWKGLLCGDQIDPGDGPIALYSYTRAGPIRHQWTRIFLSKWKWLRSEVVVALVLLVWAWRKAGLRLDGETAPLVVLAATIYPLMVLVWHGDAMETQRHALVVMISARLVLWGVYAVSVDRLVRRYFPSSAATAGGTMSATSPSSRSVASSS